MTRALPSGLIRIITSRKRASNGCGGSVASDAEEAKADTAGGLAWPCLLGGGNGAGGNSEVGALTTVGTSHVGMSGDETGAGAGVTILGEESLLVLPGG